MSSLKMTFSLTSLIFLIAFGLVFAPTVVMAAEGGPTPTITEYSGLDNPNEAASATNAMHEQERTDFRLQVTFDALVEADLAEGGFAVSVAEAVGKATEVTTTSGITAVTAITRGANAGKAYMVVVNLNQTASTTHTANTYSFGYISFVVNADQVDGTQAGHSTNGLGNVRSAPFEVTSQLPKANDWTVTATLGTNAPEIADNMFTVPASGADPNTFTVLLTLSGGTGNIPGITDAAQVQIKNNDGETVSFAAAPAVAQSGLVSTLTFTISNGDTPVATPIFVGINPNWANAVPARGLKIPADAAPGVTENPPEAMIEVSGLDEAEREFRISVTFTPAAKSDGSAGSAITGFGSDGLDIKDAADGTVLATEEAARKDDNSYTAILKYDRLATLPLTITINQSVRETSNPDHSAMVGEADPGTTPPPANAPAKPDAPTAMINADNDLVIDVSWTAPADGGSAITGYTVKKYGSDGMLVKTFPETGDPAITDTMLAVGPIPEADRGMSFTFTVTAMNANGSGPESDASDAVMVPEAPAVTSDPPVFVSGASIADIIIWAGHAFESPVLPKARAEEGVSFLYKVREKGGDAGDAQMLPNGFKLLHDDSENRVLSTEGATVMAKTAYEYVAYDTDDEMNESDAIEFNVTVLAPIKPTAPTIVSAMEEGLVDDPRARMVNTNKVVTTWEAPVDTTMTSHNPAIPFGAKITAYMVTRVNKADSTSMTYPRANDDDIAADATMHTTPDVLDLGTYGFKVAAVNSVGKGAYSESEDALVANPPSIPGDLRAAAVTGEPDAVTLDWQASTDNGGAPVIGHTVYQTLDEDTTDEDADEDLTHKVEGLESGRYVFRVAAVNSDGEGMKSEGTEFIVTVPEDPTAPVNVKPTFGNETVDNITATVGTGINAITLPAATDPDGDDGDITYSLSPNPRLIGLSFNASTRFLSGTPARAQGQTTYTYTATDSGGGKASLNFTITVNAVPVVVPPDPPVSDDLDATYDPATGVTTIRTATEAGTMIPANGFATIGYDALPDLEEFFDLGGTIGLSNADATDDKNSRTVVISEILWGLDLGASVDYQTKWQFIELYNTTGTAMDLNGWTLTFTEGRPVPASDIDQVSNRSGTGWNLDKGNTHGQSGRVTGTLATDLTSAITPTNIISMYRNIDYDKVEKIHDANNATENRKKQLDGFPSGNASGSWKASQRRSQYNRWIYDSKRRKHFKSTAILTASNVAGTPFRINEIGNDTGADSDWVELHNVTDAEASLKNYALSIVTAKGTDTRVFHFHDQDWKVGAKGYVVISTRHPRDTDLAAGKDISIADDQEENKGASHLFVVKSVNLPDDGKFALILRNAHDKQGGDGHLIDVVATTAGAFADADIGTSLWPLKATGGPHGNVIDGGDEVFKAGLVYQRNGGNGRGEKQFAVRGFTGIGYDRIADNTSVNGGTPGYDNGAIKEKIADLSDADVTFSEIMLDVGEGRQNLPQWIEIYNSSMIQSVNLNGWKLHIENANDVDTSLDSVLTLNGMVIPPNQTVLIVTNTGRVSDPDHFPSNRVVNLWTTKKHRDALEIVRRADQVFSQTGLYLKLTDKDNKLVDEAGNLDGNRRTRDEPNWTIPMSDADDGRRSSLIRVYDAGVAIDGTMEAAWVLADATNLAYAISETYYGDPDDYGTPGFRGGGPLPVSLSKFRPERLDTGEIVIRWITESELNNAGFNILRSDTRNGEYTQLNTQLIAGQGTTSERTAYEWKDTTAKPNVVYYYQIQDVSLDGEVTTLRQSRLKGDVSPAGKLTTTWGELKALQ